MGAPTAGSFSWPAGGGSSVEHRPRCRRVALVTTGRDDVADDDDPEEEAPEASPVLREAVKQLLAGAHSAERARGAARWRTDQDRLGRLLELVGQLNNERLEAGGLFVSDQPEPRDEQEREDQVEQERAFARHCADRLAAIAAVAIDFAIELAASFDDDGSSAKARNEATKEIRDELLSELATHGPRLGVPRLTALKRDVAEHVGLIVLPAAALDIADAVYELAHSHFPGQAGSTATYLAANVLAAGEEIAAAAGYHDWPALDDDFD